MLLLLLFGNVYRQMPEHVASVDISNTKGVFLDIQGVFIDIQGVFFLTDKRRPNAPPAALPALPRTAHVGEVLQSMTGARETITVVMTFKKSNRNSLERRAGGFPSSRKRNTL